MKKVEQTTVTTKTEEKKIEVEKAEEKKPEAKKPEPKKPSVPEKKPEEKVRFLEAHTLHSRISCHSVTFNTLLLNILIIIR